MDSHSKVLITGIGGFTGQYLRDYLQSKDFSVYGISNHESDEDRVYRCDITKREEIECVLREVDPEYIIHLAAISFVGHKNIPQIYEVNVVGSENLLKACVSECSSIKKVIVASSATVYGNQDINTYHEGLCANPVNHYGISKYAMEQIARTFFSKLPIVIARPFNYTAPGQETDFVIPKIAAAFNERLNHIELGNTKTYREYNGITLVNEAYYRLLLSGKPSEIYNICSGKTYSLEEIINIFSEITGHELEIKINPEFVRPNEIVKLSGDPSKLSELLGYAPQTDIRETIKSFVSV